MLSGQELLLMGIIVAGMAIILSGRLRVDIVGMLILIALGMTGLVQPGDLFSGFSAPAIITIIALFIITHALEETGVVQWIADRLRTVGGGREGRLAVLVMATGAGLALFMNIIAAGALLLPAVISVARDSNVRASKLLIPLSYGTLIGATATYFATANIVLSTLLMEQGQPGLNVLSFVPTGIPIILCGLLYMGLLGGRLLPDRESVSGVVTPRSVSRSLYETYQLEERMWEVRVLPGARVVNHKLRDSHIGEALGVTVLAIWRDHEAILTPDPDELLLANDYLLVLGREDRVMPLNAWGLQVGRENGVNGLRDYSVDLTEVVIPPRSNAIGKTLQDLRFRNKYGLTSVALWREGRSYRTDVGKFPLRVGDALLMVGPAKKIQQLAQERDFLVLQSSHAARPRRPEKGWLALAILLAAVFASILEIVPTAEAMFIGAVAMILTGCLTIDEAYRSVDWRVVFLIACMLPVSLAMGSTGLSERMGGLIVEMTAPLGGLALIAGLFLLAMAFTQFLTGQVTSLIIGPIAVSAALQFGVDPRAVAVATATACATAFLLPTAHTVNVLMMGPGGYKPADFVRIGIGMTLIVFVVLMVGMALIWGIR